MEEYVLTAAPRAEFGSRVARRLRKSGLVPANIYGHGVDNIAISLKAKEFLAFLDAGHRVATIVVEGRDEHGVVKEVQYDALGASVLHVDFTRITKGETIALEIPIEIVGVPHGVSGGGVMEFRHKEIRIEGPPDQLPENYQLNVESVKLGSMIRVKDLQPPTGCKILDDPELVVIAVGEAQALPEEAPQVIEPSEPEVIGRKKEEAEEE